MVEETKCGDESGSCCSTGGEGGRRGAPAVERHTRGGGKEGDGDDGREVEWRVNSRILMINWRKCSCYCFVFFVD